MKQDNWLVYGIIFLTSTTTIMTMNDGSLWGFMRGVGFAIVLDWLIVFWESKSEKLVDATQRKFARGMKWAGISMLVAIAFTYVITSLVPVDAVQEVDIFGMVFASTIRETIHWTIVGVISIWVVVTLGVLMYVREIDPETKKQISLSKAHEAEETEEIDAYAASLKGIGRLRGTEKAITRLRASLKADGCTQAEIEELVKKAQAQIQQDRGDIIPAAPMLSYAADTSGMQLVETAPKVPAGHNQN